MAGAQCNLGTLVVDAVVDADRGQDYSGAALGGDNTVVVAAHDGGVDGCRGPAATVGCCDEPQLGVPFAHSLYSPNGGAGYVQLPLRIVCDVNYGRVRKDTLTRQVSPPTQPTSHFKSAAERPLEERQLGQGDFHSYVAFKRK